MVRKESTCRCCLSETESKLDLYDFSSEVSIDADNIEDPQNFVRISECFSRITTIKISDAKDEDTSKICSQCLSDLKFCFLFQRKCLDTEKVYSRPLAKKENSLVLIVRDTRAKAEEIIPEYDIEDEYENVLEEYVEEMNDSDTNDGFENEDGIMKDDSHHSEEESHEEKKISPESVEILEEKTYSVQCDLCHKVFDRKDNYRRHYRRTHLARATLESSEHLTEDGKLPELTQLQLYQCDFCGKISVSPSEHESHEKEHEGEARFKCKRCEAKFITKESAREHLLSAHSADEKLFHCQMCFKTFKNRYQLVLHTRSHTGEKPFECPVCHRCFSMSSNLQKHLDTHSTDKPYNCETCGQFFKTQRSLKFHTVCYHQPEAKIKCQQCDKTFVNKSYLKMHMLYHTGEKNFTCTICKSKYYKSSHLKRHIQNVHFKLRLMKCEFCSSDFVRKETYKAHILSHHKRSLSDAEYEEVIERIKKFQAPHFDIDQYTVEKQKTSAQDVIAEEGEMGEMEEDGEDGMVIEPEDDYYEENELYEDEQ